MRKTFRDAKDSRIPAVLNVSPDDPRFGVYLNEATENLVKTGEGFWGLNARFQFCLSNGCITEPRQIAAVEAVAVGGHPIPIHNAWFQFLENGPGIQGERRGSAADSCCGGSFGICGGLAFEEIRGSFPCFNDIIGDNKRIRVYTDLTEATDAKILLQGYDENGNWIRTLDGGNYVDGEYVSLYGGPKDTTKLFTALTGVQKPITLGTVRLYEYDTDLATQRPIAIYEYDETNPSYRRAQIPGLADVQGACENKQVTVMAKLEFIPVRKDTDWLMIGNLPALKLECQAIVKQEKNLFEESMAYHALALKSLRDELRHYVGHGAINPIRMLPRKIAGGGVPNLI